MKKSNPAKAERFDHSKISRVADRLLAPVAVIAPDSTIEYANGDLARILNVDLRRLRGQKMLDLIHPEDRAPVAGELTKIMIGEPQGGFSRFRLRGHQQQDWRVFNAYAHNLTDDPSIGRILVSGGDVTEQESLTRALKSFSDVTRILVHAKDEKSLVTAVCDSIIANSDFLACGVTYAVRGEQKTVHVVASSGLVECVDSERTLSDDCSGRNGPTMDAIRTKRVQVFKEPREWQLYEPWRNQLDAYGVQSVCSLPLFSGDEVVGALTLYSGEGARFGRDEITMLTEYADELSFGIGRLRDMRRLDRNESQLREAERLARAGHWEWDLESNNVEFKADGMYVIYGTGPSGWRGTMNAFLDFIPAEERERVTATLDHTLITGSVELTHRIVNGVGDTRYLHVRTQLIMGDDDDPVRVFGTSVDITDAKLAQQQIESSRELILAITDNMHEGMIATDTQGTITFVNAAASRIVKIDASELKGSSASSLFRFEPPSGTDVKRRGTDLCDVWKRGTHIQNNLALAVGRDGDTVPVALTASPLVAECIKGSVIVFEDISSHVIEQQRIEDELDKLAWWPN